MCSSIHVRFPLMAEFVLVEVSQQIISQLLSVTVLSRTADNLRRTHFQNLRTETARASAHLIFRLRQGDDTGLNAAAATDKGEASPHGHPASDTPFPQNQI